MQPMCSPESLDQLFDQETADKPRRDAHFQSQNHKFCPGKLFHLGSRQCSDLKDPSHSCVQVKFGLIIAKFLIIFSQFVRENFSCSPRDSVVAAYADGWKWNILNRIHRVVESRDKRIENETIIN